jgi:hypothetical protein
MSVHFLRIGEEFIGHMQVFLCHALRRDVFLSGNR